MCLRLEELTSGMMVIIRKRDSVSGVYARREPKGLFQSKGNRITIIPNRTTALYMSTKESDESIELRRNGKEFSEVYYHFVLWDGRPVWVSSIDCYLEESRQWR